MSMGRITTLPDLFYILYTLCYFYIISATSWPATLNSSSVGKKMIHLSVSPLYMLRTLTFYFTSVAIGNERFQYKIESPNLFSIDFAKTARFYFVLDFFVRVFYVVAKFSGFVNWSSINSAVTIFIGLEVVHNYNCTNRK